MKDFLDLMEGDESLELTVAERTQHLANLEERIGKFITFMNFRPSKRRYILESYAERQAFLQEGAESTSDLSNLFGTVLDRTLLAKYKIQKPVWRTYTKVGTQRDFRAQNILGVFGLQSNLSRVAELEEYKADKLADGKVSCQVYKYGRLFPLSFEAMINDDLGALSDAADRLANAAIRTEIYQATKLFVASSGPSTSVFGTALTHPIDGGTVANKGTLPLTSDNLFATTVLMANQVDTDGEPVVIDGFVLVVPPKKYQAALVAVNPAALVATGVGASAALSSSYNATANLPIDIVVNSYLPIIDTTHGDTTWYLFAKLSNGAAIQMNFLAGHETPELCMKASDKVAMGGGLIPYTEGDFRNDAAYNRVRHILGGAVIDPRMAYAQAATT